ncbi:MAG: hypothetical protein GTO16_11305 [Candidatus Aminicenantes bacterium]|nr:hypothetical protein [Candidatus Aminicenantes bacterium]
MRSEKSVNNRKKESMEFFNIDEEVIKARKSDMIFFIGGTQERRDLDMEIEDFFPGYSEEKYESSREYTFKRKLFWLFIEYFFMNSNIPLKEMIESIEKIVILKTLYRVHWNQKEAAKILGVKYTTLNEKIRKYDINLRKKSS